MADGEAGKAVCLLFRIAALVLSVAAAVVMGTASQLVVVDGDRRATPSRTVSTTLSSKRLPSSLPHAHTRCLRALRLVRRACRYFVAAHAISAVCSAVALYLCAVRAAAAIGSLPLVPLLDAAAVTAQGNSVRRGTVARRVTVSKVL